MKTIERKSTHERDYSHDVLFVKIEDKVVKITYKSENASERCTLEMFNGTQWNHIFCMLDMGEIPAKSSYIWSEERRKERADDLFKKAKNLLTKILKG